MKAKWFAQNFPHLPVGVLFYGTSPTVVEEVKRYKEHGFFYVAECDEAGMANEEYYSAAKVAVPNLAAADLFVSWGSWHSAVVRSRSADVPILESGSPRMDLNRPDIMVGAGEAQFNQGELGDYVLITSNGLTPWSKLNRSAVRAVVPDLLGRFPLMSSLDLEALLLEGVSAGERFRDITLKVVRRNPTIKFIYRPRFGDNLEKIKRALKPFRNVLIVAEGPIYPLLRSARGVIHQDCTSGLEAALLGKPTVNFSPLSKKYPMEVSKVLPKAENLLEIEEFIAELKGRDGGTRFITAPEDLGPYVVNVNRKRLASDVIVSRLNEVGGDSSLTDDAMDSLRNLDSKNGSPARKTATGRTKQIYRRWKRLLQLARGVAGLSGPVAKMYGESLSASQIDRYMPSGGHFLKVEVSEISAGKAYMLK